MPSLHNDIPSNNSLIISLDAPRNPTSPKTVLLVFSSHNTPGLHKLHPDLSTPPPPTAHAQAVNILGIISLLGEHVSFFPGPTVETVIEP